MTRLQLLLDTLGASEDHPTVRGLVDLFGGTPVATDERLVDEPAHRSRRLTFASGGEIVLHDGAVVAVLLHVRPTPFARTGIDLRDWLGRAGRRTTLDGLAKAVDARPRFGGRYAYFERDGGFVRCRFDGRWTEPGHLVEFAVTLDQPGRACQPDDDTCPVCGDLPVRAPAGDGLDVDATVVALHRRRDDGLLSDTYSPAPLADLQLLHRSGLMERVESQLDCSDCGRISALTLHRDGPATFGHVMYDEARRRPMEAIPPVEQWGDAARTAAAADALRYVDHRPGSWFLARRGDDLYLESRYVRSSMVDGSCLVRLEPAEVEGYECSGAEYLDDLARRIDVSRPWSQDSPVGRRNLHLDSTAADLVAEFAVAVRDHRWVAERRQAAHRRMLSDGD